MTYPTIMPALTLDFQNSQQLDPRVTFSRSSSATYINSAGSVVSAAEHEPRFDHDPVTGECLGLLIEESRTNYAPVSQPTTSQLQNTYAWITMSDGFAAPDGTTSAVKLISTEATDQNSTNRGVNYNTAYTMPTTGYITCSVYVKPLNNLAKVTLCGPTGNGGFYGAGGTRVDFTVSPPVVTPPTGFGYEGGSLTEVGNGWYRIEFLFNLDNSQTTPSGSTKGPRVNPYGAGTEVLFWGLQMEAAKFPTWYIPTAGATVTRSVDIASITGTNFSSWYNQNQGTVLSNFKSPVPEANARYWLLITNGANSLTDGYRFEMNAILASTSTGANAWSSTGDWLSTGYTQNAENRTAFGYDRINNFNSFSNNGVIQETNTSATDVTVAPTTITIGAAAANQKFSGHISRIAYYNERLTDAELQTLTL